MLERNPLPLAPVALVDVHYSPERASAACVVAETWLSAVPVEVRRTLCTEVAAYIPGQFFRREMPPVLGVLREVTTEFQAIVVDSYVVLDEQGSPGFGARLYEYFEGRYPVVGIAKTAFRESTFATPVLRGGSKRPLFVTAMGVGQADAAQMVAAMHGEHRLPTLVQLVDSCARGRGCLTSPFGVSRT